MGAYTMKRITGTIGAVAAALVSGHAVGLEPNGLPVGEGLTFYPAIGLDAGYESNYFRLPSDEIDKWVSVLRPSLELQGVRGPSVYGLVYEAEAWWVSGSSNDSYVNHRVAGDAAFQFNLRNRLSLALEYRDWNDRRGGYDVLESGRQNLLDEDPDQWHEPKANAVYSYGAPSARGRIEIFGDYGWRRYDNNNQEDRNRDTGNIGGAFFFRVQPKTQALLEARYRRINYVNEDPGTISLDSKETRLFVGAVWDATAKTTGTVRIGGLRKDFDASERKDYSGASWEVNVNWKPRSYSMFDLTTSQMPYETVFATDDYILVTSIGLDWTHDWNSRVESKLGILYQYNDFSETDQTDKRWRFGAGIKYQMRRWLDLGASYWYDNRDSDIDTSDFKNNVLMLKVEAAL